MQPITILSDSIRPVPVTGVKVTTANQFSWLSIAERSRVMTACIDAATNLQALTIVMYENHTTIEVTEWNERTCGDTLFNEFGGREMLELLAVQTSYDYEQLAQIGFDAFSNGGFRYLHKFGYIWESGDIDDDCVLLELRGTGASNNSDLCFAPSVPESTLLEQN